MIGESTWFARVVSVVSSAALGIAMVPAAAFGTLAYADDGGESGTGMALAPLSADFSPGAESSARMASADTTNALAFQFADNAGGSYTDCYQHVAFTKDGGFVVGGYTMGASTDPEWSYAPTTNHKNNNAVLVKYDSNHEIEWSRSYGEGNGVVLFNDMDVLADGRIAAIGKKTVASGVPQVGGSDAIKNVSWFLLLVNPKNPESYSEYYIGGTAGDEGFGIAATSDGGFVATGWSGGGSSAGYITSRSVTGTTSGEFSVPQQLWQASDGAEESLPKRTGQTDTIVVKFDSNGSPAWTSVDNVAVATNAKFGTAAEKVEAVAVDESGDVIVVGQGQLGKNVYNATIAKLKGSTGELLWHRSAGRSGVSGEPSDAADYMKNASFIDVDVLADGSYVAVGSATQDANTEEAWETTAQKDTIVVHYEADGSIRHVESFGRIGDSNSRPEGVTALSDGGYLVFGSQSGYLYEDDLLDRGYNWGNYGAQDAILVKYSEDDEVMWSENYGSTNGDWFNDVAEGSGEIVVVGESNGKYGSPSWGNNGGIDGIVLVSNGSTGGASSESGIVADGAVEWADGTFTGVGTGYAGDVKMSVTVSGHKITTLESTENSETASYFKKVTDSLYQAIIDAQSAKVDVVSGATLSSNGVKEGVTKALSESSADTVDALISAIAAATDDDAKKAATQAAADAYAQLGTYAIDALQADNKQALAEAAQNYGITLTTKAGVEQIVETKPEYAASGLAYNDRYYKLQNEYYRGINATALADGGYTGKGVKVAVIDSGITGSQKDLDYSRILNGWDYGDGKSYDAESAPGTELAVEGLYDNDGHGTAVAGILAATSGNGKGVSGLLSQVQLVPLRAIPVNGKTADYNTKSSKQVAQAITDAVDKFGVDVITTSLDVVQSDELAAAVAHAKEQGVIITGASGNSSTAASTGDDAYIYPASYDEVVSVGAVDKNLNVRANSQKNDKVFVTAPGENIALLDISRNARCTVSSGTSYASPVVAAMAAAAKQASPNIGVEQFESLLKATSADKGTEGFDPSYGYGVVDMQAFSAALDSISLSGMKTSYSKTYGNGAFMLSVPESIDARELSFKSSAPSVVSVDKAGKVTIKKAGTAAITVTATYGGVQTASKSVKVTVGKAPASITAPAGVSKTFGDAAFSLGAKLARGDGKLSYSTSNAKVAAVDSAGKVSVKGAGAATITVKAAATANYKAASKSVKVTVGKASQTISPVKKTYSVKYSKVKKKAQKIAVKFIATGAGKVTYAAAKSGKASLAKNGKVTVKKGAKRKTYTLKVKATAAATSNYVQATQVVKLKVKVK